MFLCDPNPDVPHACVMISNFVSQATQVDTQNLKRHDGYFVDISILPFPSTRTRFYSLTLLSQSFPLILIPHSMICMFGNEDIDLISVSILGYSSIVTHRRSRPAPQIPFTLLGMETCHLMPNPKEPIYAGKYSWLMGSAFYPWRFCTLLLASSMQSAVITNYQELALHNRPPSTLSPTDRKENFTWNPCIAPSV